jgi:hypothetical protein
MAMSGLMAAALSSPDLVYDKYREQFNRGINDTETAISTSLRIQYPSLKLTSCDAAVHDLVGFAQAGNAKLTLLEPHTFHAVRNVTTVGANAQRVGNLFDCVPMPDSEVIMEEDSFASQVKFARYLYEWGSQEYLVYLVQGYSSGYWNNFYHILCEASTDDDSLISSKAIDRLMYAAASWTATLREEIMVFNQGRWLKDSALFKSVLSTTWDDVILECSMKSSILRDVEGFFAAEDMYKDLGVPWKVINILPISKRKLVANQFSVVEGHHLSRRAWKWQDYLVEGHYAFAYRT